MKKKFASLLIVLSAFLLMIQGVQADFTDTADHLYEESILALQELGVLNGYEDGSFLPDNPVSRAELLKVVFAALDEEAAEFSGSCFYDVTGDWYGPYVCHAKSLGIVNGYDDGYFRPGQEVNLVEAFKIIQESFELDLRELEDGEAWYEGYVEFMHTNNLYSRYNSYPDRSATRGEVAFWVHQLLKIQEGEREIQEERLPSYSAGCGLAAPETVPNSFTVDGEERSTISVVPDDYDPNESYALLIAFHGRTSDNEDVQGYYKVEEPSDGQAIIIYPAGTESNGSFSWKNSGDSASELRDYEFFDDIVEEFTSSYCINEDEIYAIGHSLGAWFTNSLACARGDVLRAVASLGGGRSESVCTGPVAVMQWHNPNDEHSPYYTGLTTRDFYLEQNRCSSSYSETSPYWGNCVEYSGCLDHAPVLWCPHTNNYSDYSGEYYPHTWPRGTGEEMWNFFEAL